MKNLDLIVKNLRNYNARDIIVLLEKYTPDYLEKLAKTIVSRAEFPPEQGDIPEDGFEGEWYVIYIREGHFVKDGRLSLKAFDDIPEEVTKLRIMDPDLSVNEIADNFLSDSGLTHLDLSNVSNVKTIGSGFLDSSELLVELILFDLSNVIEIGYAFLRNCQSLQQVDLSGLANVEYIGNKFLFASGLRQLRLPVLPKMTEIGHEFLNYCIDLIQVDLSGLENVTFIGKSFMNNCSSLRKLDLSFFTKLTTIQTDFLRNCTSLEQLNVSNLFNVTVIGYDFLRNTPSLNNIIINRNTSEILSEILITVLKRRGKKDLIESVDQQRLPGRYVKSAAKAKLFKA